MLSRASLKESASSAKKPISAPRCLESAAMVRKVSAAARNRMPFRHLRRCRCPHFKRGKISYHAQFGVKIFHRHLVGCGICPSESVQNLPANPALVTDFCDWFRTHRGAKEPTLRQYARGATDLLRTLGEDVSQWNALALRDFLLERASQCRKETTKSLIPALRAFLRFLNFRGECRDDLALAIPAVASWRLARLPH